MGTITPQTISFVPFTVEETRFLFNVMRAHITNVETTKGILAQEVSLLQQKVAELEAKDCADEVQEAEERAALALMSDDE